MIDLGKSLVIQLTHLDIYNRDVYISLISTIEK